jgi:hypothetical protein
LDQTEIALVDEIWHRDTGTLVFACNLYDKPQISLNEFLYRLWITLLNAPPKIGLFLKGRHWPASNFR